MAKSGRYLSVILPLNYSDVGSPKESSVLTIGFFLRRKVRALWMFHTASAGSPKEQDWRIFDFTILDTQQRLQWLVLAFLSDRCRKYSDIRALP